MAIRTLIIAVFCISVFKQVGAQDVNRKNSPLRFLGGIALEFGGDAVDEILFTDGSTQKLNAGQGGTIFAGGELRLTEAEKLFLRGSLGIKYVTTKANNAHIRLTRIPVVFSLNYKVNKFRFAGGLAMHTAIRYNSDGISQNKKFDPAAGPVVEVAYSVVGLSYTAMTYKGPDGNYRAGNIGLTLSFTLPEKR